MSFAAHVGLGFVLASGILAFEPRARQAAAALALIGGVLVMTAFTTARPVNSAALQALQDVFHTCAGQPPATRTARCAEALEIERRCRSEECTARQIYEQLTPVGFLLPPFDPD